MLMGASRNCEMAAEVRTKVWPQDQSLAMLTARNAVLTLQMTRLKAYNDFTTV